MGKLRIETEFQIVQAGFIMHIFIVPREYSLRTSVRFVHVSYYLAD